MSSDTSGLCFKCGYCGRGFLTASAVEEHIEEAVDPAHTRTPNFELEYEIQAVEPELPVEPDFQEWDEQLADAARDVMNELEGIDGGAHQGQIYYTELSDRSDVPNSYAALRARVGGLELGEEVLRPPVDGRDSPSRFEDLTGTQQESLIQVATHPDLTHEEIAETIDAGHTTQGGLSKAVRKYGWMLAHPQISPFDLEALESSAESSEGEVQVEGVQEALAAVASGESTAAEPARNEAVLEADDPDTNPGVEAEESGSSEAVESDTAEEVLEPETGVVELDRPETFEVISALLEAGGHANHELARELFRRAAE